MTIPKRSNSADKHNENGDFVSLKETTRETTIMNTIINTTVILMSAMMDAFGEIMIQATGKMATGIAKAFDEEEIGEEINKEVEKKLPEINETMKTIISDIRKDIYAQFKQKQKEIQTLLSEPTFDLGPQIVEKYDFNLPKLTEKLDDKTLVQYTLLFVSEEPLFNQMFTEITKWMNSMPKFPVKTDEP